jgi:SulP family sulfate permease
MLGFVNGLAIVIFLAQLQHFEVKLPDGTVDWMSGSPLYILLGLVALTMAIMHFLPKLTGAFPAALAAILVVSFMVIGFDINTTKVGDLASIEGAFPPFHLPAVPFSWETLTIIFPYAFILAAVGLIESLLTLSLIDDITNTRGRGNRECVGQGIANTVTGCLPQV